MLFKNLFNWGITLILTGFISQGCSNNFVQAVDPIISANEATLDYFPLNEGYRATFEISTSNGLSDVITYTVGKEVSFQSSIATQWIESANGQKDTSYLVLNGSSLTFYEGKQSKPEVILNFPLAVGKSWNRFDVTDSKITDTTTIDGKDTTNTNNEAGLSSSFLTEGKSVMTVDKLESIELTSGRYFSGVYRVSNDAGANTRNYYWYAPGVGLVKYVLGAVDSNDPTGGIQAELIDYGYNY